MHDRTEPPARELRELLAAVLEAIAIPHPATVGDAETHGRILLDRVTDARVAIEGVLQHGDDAGWSADYLRVRLAAKPATGYRTVGDGGGRQDDEHERARRSVDAQFPTIAAFLAQERAGKYAATPRHATGAELLPPELRGLVDEVTAALMTADDPQAAAAEYARLLDEQLTSAPGVER